MRSIDRMTREERGAYFAKICAEWDAVFARMAMAPAEGDSCRTPKGECDGSCARFARVDAPGETG